MERFDSINQFYWRYDKTNPRFTLDDIDRLELKLRDAGYYVKEYKNGTVIVKTPDDLKNAHNRRIAAQKKESAKYTKLGAAIPISLSVAFSDACRKLGVSQSEVLMPLIIATIERAGQIVSDD